MGAQLGNEYHEPSKTNTNVINLNNALDYYGSNESRYDLQNKMSENKMPPRPRVQSEFNVLDYFQEKNIHLSSLRRPTLHKYGRANVTVKEIDIIENQSVVLQRQKLFSKLGIKNDQQSNYGCFSDNCSQLTSPCNRDSNTPSLAGFLQKSKTSVKERNASVNSNLSNHPSGAVASPRYTTKKGSNQQIFTVKGQDGAGMIKDDQVVKDHMDREFSILQDLEMDVYDRKMTYDNWGQNPYYQKSDIQGLESSLKLIKNAQLEQGISNRVSMDLLHRQKKQLTRKNYSSNMVIDAVPQLSNLELDLIEEEQMLKDFETNSAQECNPSDPLEINEMNDCVSQTKSADDQVQDDLVDLDGKDIPNEFTLQYTDNFEQMTTVGGLTNSPSKQGCSNHGDMISDFQITAASTRHRSFSQETELITVTDHQDRYGMQRKTSMMFIENDAMNEQIEQIERRNSTGNRSFQPEIDEDNQIQLPDNLDELERADRLTEVAQDDIIDGVDNDLANDLPVPNDEIEPPPSVRKVEVFDDYIQAPSEVVSPNTKMFGKNVTGTVADLDDQVLNKSGEQGCTLFSLDHKKLRLRFLSKLASEKIWLPPMNQPKSNQNLVILDWDDTIFPTSHLNPVDETQYDFLLEKYSKYLIDIESEAIKLINSCLKTCKVVIITNAKKGWVEFSSSKFMPKLHNLLMNSVKIVSARVDYEDQYPMDTYKWKQLAFQKLWECKDLQLDKASITNLITFGDSEYEMEAARKFGAKHKKCFVKLIKLRECPSFDELHKELLVINDRFNYIFQSYKNLTIRLEKQVLYLILKFQFPIIPCQYRLFQGQGRKMSQQATSLNRIVHTWSSGLQLIAKLMNYEATLYILGQVRSQLTLLYFYQTVLIKTLILERLNHIEQLSFKI
eukprot:403347439